MANCAADFYRFVFVNFCDYCLHISGFIGTFFESWCTVGVKITASVNWSIGLCVIERYTLTDGPDLVVPCVDRLATLPDTSNVFTGF